MLCVSIAPAAGAVTVGAVLGAPMLTLNPRDANGPHCASVNPPPMQARTNTV